MNSKITKLQNVKPLTNDEQKTLKGGTDCNIIIEDGNIM